MLRAIPRHKLISTSLDSLNSNIQVDSTACFPKIDTIDNPHTEPSRIEKDIFNKMKYERNRLYSFQNKWPLREITAESLAGAGLFYLQQEDAVQCPFCFVKISNWTYGDNPLREHMRRKPKCPFLMGTDVGNVPIARDDRQMQLTTDIQVPQRHCLSHSLSLSYKPKHPRLADIKRRILTYSGWPVSWLAPQQLAECGLYYSGIADVVTCFFCGGSLGNWEPNDDPWNEHTKFFPDCAFLAVAKNKHSKVLTSHIKDPSQLKGGLCNGHGMSSNDITTDIIQEANDIFPEDVVLESVKRNGANISSLPELCNDILDLKRKQYQEDNSSIAEDTKPRLNNGASSSQALLCVICMDRERGVAYQPCGHFVSCPNCANMIADCPVCRKPITQKIRIYHT